MNFLMRPPKGAHIHVFDKTFSDGPPKGAHIYIVLLNKELFDEAPQRCTHHGSIDQEPYLSIQGT